MRYRGNGADVDVYANGKGAAPLATEVKARKAGAGFVTLESWLGGNDALFLKRNHADPLIVLPWRTWAQLLTHITNAKENV